MKEMGRPLTKKEVLKLLQKGAQIEFTAWGLNPSIYIRLNSEDLFERVHQKAFLALRDIDKVLKLVSRETLTSIWVLKDELRHKVQSTVEYAEKECSTCKDLTSHVLVDHPSGKGHVWQCEICATFWQEEQ